MYWWLRNSVIQWFSDSVKYSVILKSESCLKQTPLSDSKFQIGLQFLIYRGHPSDGLQSVLYDNARMLQYGLLTQPRWHPTRYCNDEDLAKIQATPSVTTAKPSSVMIPAMILVSATRKNAACTRTTGHSWPSSPRMAWWCHRLIYTTRDN